MKTWSFYRLSDGSFLTREFSAPDDQSLAQNTPAGCAALEGRYDSLSQRVDLDAARQIGPHVDELRVRRRQLGGGVVTEESRAIDPQIAELCRSCVVDHVPPQPDADHEWNATTKRWQKRAEVVEREARRAAAQARIEELERKQARPMRELAIDPSNAQAAQGLRAIESEIAALRGPAA